MLLRTRSCHLQATAALVWFALASPLAARAATFTWSAVANGAAGTAANWIPAAVPGSADSCQYILNGQYTVTFGANVPAVRGQLVRWGGVTMQFPTGWHTTSGRVQVGSAAAQACSLVVTDGTLLATSQLQVGAINGTDGVLAFSGGAAAGILDGLQPQVGTNGGTGTLEVMNGAAVVVRDIAPTFGWDAGHGTLRVVGVASGDAYDRSTYRDSLAANSLCYVGNSSGDGRVEVLDGAQAEFSQIVDFGGPASGTGTLWVGGASTVDSARAIFRGHLGVGHSENSASGGNGIITCAAGGVIDVAGNTYVGDPANQVGATLEIRGGSRFHTHSLYLENGSTLDFGGGVLQVEGGTLDTRGNPLTLNGGAHTPKLQLLGGADGFVEPTTSPALVVGEDGPAELHVLGNSTLTVGANAIVGDATGAAGLLACDGSLTQVDVNGDLTVGRSGTGSLDVTGGADMTAVALRVGSQTGSTGNVDVTGAGSELALSGGLALGGTLTAASGGSLGLLDLENDGRLVLAGTTASKVWGGGILTLASGGVLELDSRLELRGLLSLGDGSSLGTGQIAPLEGGRIIGYGTLASRFVAPADTTGLLHAGGPLSLGRADAADGYDCRAGLEVLAQPVTIADLDSAIVGSVTIAGGTLTGPVGGLVIPAPHRLQGTGIVATKLRPLGPVFAEGLLGLHFAGELTGSAIDLSGTFVRFAPGGSFTGGGVLESNVWVDSAATFRATSPTQVGDFFRVTSLLVDGDLVAAPGVTTNIVCSDTTRVRGSVTLEGGTVFPWYAPLHVRGGGRLQGTGGVSAPTLVDGRLDPGGALALGRISISGNLTLRSGARTWFDLGSFTLGQRDTIAVTGNAQLGGTLDLRPASGFRPQVGDSFLVVSGASVTGTFANVTVLGQPASSLIQMRYRPTGAWAIVLVGGLDAPADGDGPRALRFAPLGSPAHAAVFALDLPADADVTAELFDVNGRRVVTLQRGPLPAGRHVLRPRDGEVTASGLYFARLAARTGAGVERRTTRVTLLH